MNLEMSRLLIVGLRSELESTLQALRRLGCVQIDEVADWPEVSARPLRPGVESLQLQEETTLLVARLEGLLEALGVASSGEMGSRIDDCLPKARAGLAELSPRVQTLTARRDELMAEMDSLPRYEVTLRRLLPIIPPAARQPGNMSVGLLVSKEHLDVLDLVGREALQLTGGRAEVAAGNVDGTTRAMLIVFPRAFADPIEELLGREDVSRLRLPAEFEQSSPEDALTALRRRLAVIPRELEDVERELAQLAAVWHERLLSWRRTLRDELEAYSVLSEFGETEMTFVVVGWVPTEDFASVKSALGGETVLVQEVPLTREAKKFAPVVLKNPQLVRPFESLVGLLSLPRYGGTDPSRLMAFFFPLFFGMILGDAGYGTLLLAISLGLARRLKRRIVRDVLTVLAMGSGWAILFGFLYGEAFGTLGERLGMHPLWFERAGPEHVAGLLLMALVIGALHITLGLVLGVWEAARERSRSHLLERGGMLVGLIGLFTLTGVLVDFLPRGFMTPAVAGLIVGIALLGASLGWLGVLMGPIEFIGLIGNVLSYLRIAAIGLASVYLAKVANDMVGMLGNVIVGVIVAVLIHALNLVLGAFSPSIHSLRLHYVEFFRKFYEGGGRAYEPFRSQFDSE